MNPSLSTQSPVRFGYVGCGYVAQHIHIPNFAALPECEFKVIAEVRPELGNIVAARYNIPCVVDSHFAIANDPEIEAVGVSGPYALQGRIAEDLLRAGKHVFMEKPMAVSLERAQKLLDAEKAGNARLMVGYMKRFDSGNLILKAHLDRWRESGEMGRLLLVRNHGFGGNWTFGQDPNVPFSNSQASPPPPPNDCPAWLPPQFAEQYLNYLQQWTHNINLLRFLLGDQGETQVKNVQLDSDGMTGIVVLEINGVRAVVESGYINHHGWDEHTQIYFEGGWLKTQAPPLMHKETPATVEIYQGPHKGRDAELIQQFAAPMWSYRQEAKHFLSSVRTGNPFVSGAADTFHDVRIYEDIYRAFCAGRN